MAEDVVCTPVEPLVLGDDRTASRVLTTEAVRDSMVSKMTAPSSLNVEDDDAEDEQDAVADDGSIETTATATAASLESVDIPEPQGETSPRTPNPQVNTQKPLASETAPAQSAAVTAPTLDKQTPTQTLASAEAVAPVGQFQQPLQSEQEEHDPTVDAATTMGLLHEFLYQKITENQCNSHAKEIHQFISAHLNEKQQATLVPQVVLHLSRQFQQEALGQEVSVDVQTSLCLIEQMLLSEGRRSPLQDMYTAEEEEMLNQLVHAGSSNNVLNQ